jgi:hypothetical protein
MFKHVAVCKYEVTVRRSKDAPVTLTFNVPSTKFSTHSQYHMMHFEVRSQNCEKWQLISSCLSVCPHGTNRLPLNGFS